MYQFNEVDDSRAKFAQSHQRRFSRWLHNRINVQRLYSPIIQAALSKWGSQEIVFIEDKHVVESLLLNSSFGSIPLDVQFQYGV